MAEFLMPLRSLFEAVAEYPSSIALRESQFMWPWVIVIHVVSMATFAGLVLMMDLRLLGVGNMRTPFSEVQRRLFPWQMGAMGLTSITGVSAVTSTFCATPPTASMTLSGTMTPAPTGTLRFEYSLKPESLALTA